MIGLIAGLAVIGIILGYPTVAAPEPKSEPQADVRTSATLWMNPMAIVIPGDNPLWFELSDNGPVVIPSPEEASLREFLPWPHSLHVKDMLIQENRLVMAVNRLGFLVFIPWDSSRLGMYSVFDKAYWSRYSIASLFSFDQTPEALLYRDDFFSGNEDVPLPKMPVKGLVKGSTQPIDITIPAFTDFPSSKGWDIEALHRVENGGWYFIAAQKSSDRHEKHYFKTDALNEQPSSISMGDYWLALEPESLQKTSLLLQNTANEAMKSRPENLSYLIEAMSPNSESEIRYAYNSGGASDMISLFAYVDDEKALAVFYDGNGAIGTKTANDSINTSVFSLPKLPKDYFYTGIALADNTIVASWEEQQSYGVGAAGFVLVKAPF
jgi:hypothetical protein